MEELYKKSGERIQIMRNMRGYTREELAELAGISPKFLYEVESGKKGFSAAVLYHICKALDVDCDYILTGESEKEYDKELIDVLELFEKDKSNHLVNILREIHAIM